MAAVTKSNGKFTLQPDPLLAARARSAQDKSSLDKGISESELRALLASNLLRLEHLEQE